MEQAIVVMALYYFTNGPITVFAGPEEAITAMCQHIIGKENARGCVTVQYGDPFEASIFCPVNDIECLAHEIRHLLDANWVHDEKNETKEETKWEVPFTRTSASLEYIQSN